MELSRTIETETGEMIVKRVSVPLGLEELMEGLAKEVILRKPKDIYAFASEYFARLLQLRDSGLYRGNVRSAKLAVKHPSKAMMVGHNIFSSSESDTFSKKDTGKKPSTPHYLNHSSRSSARPDEIRRARIREHLRLKKEEQANIKSNIKPHSIKKSEKTKSGGSKDPTVIVSCSTSTSNRKPSREKVEIGNKLDEKTDTRRVSRKTSTEGKGIPKHKKCNDNSKAIENNLQKGENIPIEKNNFSRSSYKSSTEEHLATDGDENCSFVEREQNAGFINENLECIGKLPSPRDKAIVESENLYMKTGTISSVQDEKGQYEVSYNPDLLASDRENRMDSGLSLNIMKNSEISSEEAKKNSSNTCFDVGKQDSNGEKTAASSEISSEARDNNNDINENGNADSEIGKGSGELKSIIMIQSLWRGLQSRKKINVINSYSILNNTRLSSELEENVSKSCENRIEEEEMENPHLSKQLQESNEESDKLEIEIVKDLSIENERIKNIDSLMAIRETSKTPFDSYQNCKNTPLQSNETKRKSSGKLKRDDKVSCETDTKGNSSAHTDVGYQEVKEGIPNVEEKKSSDTLKNVFDSESTLENIHESISTSITPNEISNLQQPLTKSPQVSLNDANHLESLSESRVIDNIQIESQSPENNEPNNEIEDDVKVAKNNIDDDGNSTIEVKIQPTDLAISKIGENDDVMIPIDDKFLKREKMYTDISNLQEPYTKKHHVSFKTTENDDNHLESHNERGVIDALQIESELPKENEPHNEIKDDVMVTKNTMDVKDDTRIEEESHATDSAISKSEDKDDVIPSDDSSLNGAKTHEDILNWQEPLIQKHQVTLKTTENDENHLGSLSDRSLIAAVQIESLSPNGNEANDEIKDDVIITKNSTDVEDDSKIEGERKPTDLAISKSEEKDDVEISNDDSSLNGAPSDRTLIDAVQIEILLPNDNEQNNEMKDNIMVTNNNPDDETDFLFEGESQLTDSAISRSKEKEDVVISIDDSSLNGPRTHRNISNLQEPLPKKHHVSLETTKNDENHFESLSEHRVIDDIQIESEFSKRNESNTEIKKDVMVTKNNSDVEGDSKIVGESHPTDLGISKSEDKDEVMIPIDDCSLNELKTHDYISNMQEPSIKKHHVSLKITENDENHLKSLSEHGVIDAVQIEQLLNENEPNNEIEDDIMVAKNNTIGEDDSKIEGESQASQRLLHLFPNRIQDVSNQEKKYLNSNLDEQERNDIFLPNDLQSKTERISLQQIDGDEEEKETYISELQERIPVGVEAKLAEPADFTETDNKISKLNRNDYSAEDEVSNNTSTSAQENNAIDEIETKGEDMKESNSNSLPIENQTIETSSNVQKHTLKSRKIFLERGGLESRIPSIKKETHSSSQIIDDNKDFKPKPIKHRSFSHRQNKTEIEEETKNTKSNLRRVKSQESKTIPIRKKEMAKLIPSETKIPRKELNKSTIRIISPRKKTESQIMQNKLGKDQLSSIDGESVAKHSSVNFQKIPTDSKDISKTTENGNTFEPVFNSNDERVDENTTHSENTEEDIEKTYEKQPHLKRSCQENTKNNSDSDAVGSTLTSFDTREKLFDDSVLKQPGISSTKKHLQSQKSRLPDEVSLASNDSKFEEEFQSDKKANSIEGDVSLRNIEAKYDELLNENIKKENLLTETPLVVHENRKSEQKKNSSTSNEIHMKELNESEGTSNPETDDAVNIDETVLNVPSGKNAEPDNTDIQKFDTTSASTSSRQSDDENINSKQFLRIGGSITNSIKENDELIVQEHEMFGNDLTNREKKDTKLQLTPLEESHNNMIVSKPEELEPVHEHICDEETYPEASDQRKDETISSSEFMEILSHGANKKLEEQIGMKLNPGEFENNGRIYSLDESHVEEKKMHSKNTAKLDEHSSSQSVDAAELEVSKNSIHSLKDFEESENQPLPEAARVHDEDSLIHHSLIPEVLTHLEEVDKQSLDEAKQFLNIENVCDNQSKPANEITSSAHVCKNSESEKSINERTISSEKVALSPSIGEKQVKASPKKNILEHEEVDEVPSEKSAKRSLKLSSLEVAVNDSTSQPNTNLLQEFIYHEKVDNLYSKKLRSGKESWQELEGNAEQQSPQKSIHTEKPNDKISRDISTNTEIPRRELPGVDTDSFPMTSDESLCTGKIGTQQPKNVDGGPLYEELRDSEHIIKKEPIILGEYNRPNYDSTFVQSNVEKINDYQSTLAQSTCLEGKTVSHLEKESVDSVLSGNFLSAENFNRNDIESPDIPKLDKERNNVDIEELHESETGSTSLIDDPIRNLPEIKSAIHIQKMWRGSQARKKLNLNLQQKKLQELLNHKLSTTDENKNIINSEDKNLRYANEIMAGNDKSISPQDDNALVDEKPESNEVVVTMSNGLPLFSENDVKAALKIQSSFRRFKLRKGKYFQKSTLSNLDLSSELGRDYVNQALKIQSAWRAYKVRKNIREVEEKINEIEDHSGNKLPKSIHLTDGEILKAVTKIQASLRGFMARKHFKNLLEQNHTLDGIQEESNSEIKNFDQNVDSSDEQILNTLKQLDNVNVPNTPPEIGSKISARHLTENNVSVHENPDAIHNIMISSENHDLGRISSKNQNCSSINLSIQLSDINGTDKLDMVRNITDDNQNGSHENITSIDTATETDPKKNSENGGIESEKLDESRSTSNASESVLPTISIANPNSMTEEHPNIIDHQISNCDYICGSLKKSKATDDLVKLAEGFVNDEAESERLDEGPIETKRVAGEQDTIPISTYENDVEFESLNKKLASFDIPDSDFDSENPFRISINNESGNRNLNTHEDNEEDHQKITSYQFERINSNEINKNIDIENNGQTEVVSLSPHISLSKVNLENDEKIVDEKAIINMQEEKMSLASPSEHILLNNSEKKEHVQNYSLEEHEEGEVNIETQLDIDESANMSVETKFDMKNHDIPQEEKHVNGDIEFRPALIQNQLSKPKNISENENDESIQQTAVAEEKYFINGTKSEDNIRSNDSIIPSKIEDSVSKISDDSHVNQLKITTETDQFNYHEKDLTRVPGNVKLDTTEKKEYLDANVQSEMKSGNDIKVSSDDELRNEIETDRRETENPIPLNKEELQKDNEGVANIGQKNKKVTLTDFMKKTLYFDESQPPGYKDNKITSQTRNGDYFIKTDPLEEAVDKKVATQSRYEAAVKIQSSYRGYKSRKNIEPLSITSTMTVINPEKLQIEKPAMNNEHQSKNNSLSTEQVAQITPEQMLNIASSPSENVTSLLPPDQLITENSSRQVSTPAKFNSVPVGIQTDVTPTRDNNENTDGSQENVPGQVFVIIVSKFHPVMPFTHK